MAEEEIDEGGCSLRSLLFVTTSYHNENIFLAITGPGNSQDLISGYSCMMLVSIPGQYHGPIKPKYEQLVSMEGGCE